VQQLFAHGAGERVQPLRPVDADPADGAVTLATILSVVHAASTTVDSPWPTPTHMVASP
jgi:hypothetical protein